MIVWLASYPRSGNTFFRVILNNIFGIKTYSIYDDRTDIGADRKTAEIVGHEFLPENFNIEKARDEKKTYYIKTHELLDSRVYECDNVIYLIRDGRESTLSFAKHENMFSGQNKKNSDVIYGNTFIGSWGEHVNSWDPKGRENTLLIKFEELIKEPVKFVDILSNFLKVLTVGENIPTFEELKKINPKFFRSGKTSSWETVFSEEEHLSFWLKNYKVMLEYDYSYKMPELFNNIEDYRVDLESVTQNNYLIRLSLENEKKLNTLNKNFSILSNELNRKNNELELKYKELEKKNRELKQKDKELEQKQNVVEKSNSKLKAVMKKIENTGQFSIFLSPLKKAKAYKEMMKLSNNLKNNNI